MISYRDIVASYSAPFRLIFSRKRLANQWQTHESDGVQSVMADGAVELWEWHGAEMVERAAVGIAGRFEGGVLTGRGASASLAGLQSSKSWARPHGGGKKPLPIAMGQVHSPEKAQRNVKGRRHR